MTFVKGKSGNINGRPKGAKNLVTKEAKNLFFRFMEENEDNLQEDYDKVRVDHPDKALEIMMKAAEYVFPKLGRTEHGLDQETKDLMIQWMHDKTDNDSVQTKTSTVRVSQ